MSYSLDGYPIGRALQPEFSLLSRDSGLGPIRPKRRQVKNACTRCQKACKKCDDARPCLRCVRYGCTDACVSSVRKERKKGFKRGPYKKRDAEAQLLLSRVPSLRATRKSTDHPHQAGPPTTVSAFTNSPLAEQPNPPWDTGTDYHPHPAYHTVAAAAGAADGETPYPAAAQYLTSPPAHHPQVEQYHGQYYFQLPPQLPSHHPQHLIAPAVPASSQYYLGSMGHKHPVTGPLSYHVHHQYHA